MGEFGAEYQASRKFEDKYFTIAWQIITTLKLKPDATVLDYGCGKGFLVHAFRSFFIDAYGYDVSKEAVEQAHGLAAGHLCGDWALKPSEDFYDVLLCIDVLEHMTEGKMIAWLDTLARTAPIAVFSIPFLGDPNLFKDPTHKIFKTKEWWKYELGKHWRIRDAPKEWAFSEQFLIGERREVG